MMTRSLSSILMSAYVSAMLASSVAPMAGSITLAGAVNPDAAQAAFRTALTGAQSSGWVQVAAADIPMPPKAEPQIVVRAVPPSDPVLTDELMGRLLKLIGEVTEKSTIPADVCALFKLCDGSARLQILAIETESPAGDFIATVNKDDTTNILVIHKMDDGSVQFYLTDKTRKLRAAVISEKQVGRLVMNETVAKNYEATLSHLAKEAQDLPPTGTRVAAGS